MILGYVRVSTEEQGRPGAASPDEQERVIRGFALAKGVGAYDLQIYKDIGVSGAVPLNDRPSGGELYKIAKAGDTIVASKLDRIFRDTLDALTIYKFCVQNDIDLILFDMGMESVTKDGMSKTFFTIISAFADMERMRIAERMREGKRVKIERGGHAGGVVPYGFKKIGTGREAKLLPDEKEQTVIQRAQELYATTNRDMTHVRRRLAWDGYRDRNGSVFRYNQIIRMVTRSTPYGGLVS